VGVLGGSWELITSKMALGFYRVFVINLIVCSCFTVYMESLDYVHKIAFFGCVKYFHNFINGSHGMLLSSRWAVKLDFRMLYLNRGNVHYIFYGMIYLSGRHISCDSPGM